MLWFSGMDAAKRMGVDPVISAKEMADPEVDHLGVMAYAAWFQNYSRRDGIDGPPSPAPLPVAVSPPLPPPPPPVIEERPRTPSPPPLAPPGKRVMLTQFMRETLPANIVSVPVYSI